MKQLHMKIDGNSLQKKYIKISMYNLELLLYL
jgi:hypothetical protein